MTSPGAMRRSLLRGRLLEPHRAWHVPEGRRAAAVLVPIVSTPSGESLLFVKRRADLRHHAGQIAFPGGRAEPDEDPVACALREFSEEVGIAASHVELLGSLPCHASGAGFHVHPVVGALDDLLGLRADPHELELTFTVEVTALADATRWTTHTIERDGMRFTTPAFDFGSHHIWGLTARVVHDLLALWP